MNKTVFIVCMLAALAGLLFGIDVGVIAQAKEFIKIDLGLNDNMISWVVGSMMGGAAFGAVSAGFLTKIFGRKVSLIFSSLMFLVGALGCAFSCNGYILIVFRIVVGLAIGVASFTAPLYLSEVAPKSIRGTMISTYQLMITIGILVAFLTNTAISSSTYVESMLQQNPNDYLFNAHNSWRWMLGITSVPASIFLIGALFLPRSPRWLVSVGKTTEARGVLLKIRTTIKDVEDEISEIINTVKNNNSSGTKLFLTNSNFRRSVVLGIALQIAQQLTGINLIMYFAPEIARGAGFVSNTDANMVTIICGLTNVLATFIALYLVDKLGRKPILIIGFIMMAISLCGVSISMKYADGGVFSYLAIIFVLLFIVFFACSAGPLIWVLCSEIQPLSGRDFGITCSTGTNWIVNMIVGASFLTLVNYFGASLTMMIYAVCCVFSLLLTIFFVPETKGVSLEHLEKNLMSGVKLKNLGK
ncbi:MAG: sugar porter family MFS transporter [Succinivibrionaceae bacterium]